MPTRKTMNISITPAQERFVNRKVKAGQYQTASEVIRDGLRLLETREADRRAYKDEVRRRIEVGLAQLNRGESVDGSKSVRSIISDLRRRRRKAG